MKKKASIVIFVLLALQLMGQNVKIGDNASEVAIMMDYNNPRYMVAAANINNYYYSSDTGRTWSWAKINSQFGVWGDPVIEVDTAGDFYFFHLSNTFGGSFIDRMVCQKSNDHGKTWFQDVALGHNGGKAQDKQWSAVDRSNNTIYLTWTQFDRYGSTASSDSSYILFSKSTDGGKTWIEPKRLNKVAGDCIDDDNTVEGAVPAVGPGGEVYVAWAGPAGLRFDKSLDGGETWLDEDILIDEMPGGWAYDIPGINRCNGLPVLKCDVSGGEYNGTIYVNWSDQRNGTDNTDVWLSKSTDGGETWSKAKRVNNDNSSKQQFLTWMDIDQITGYIYFVFYDRRNYDDNKTDVYIAVSKDGGETFENIKISEKPFTPYKGLFFGDYINIVAHNNIVRPIWMSVNDKGRFNIWTDITPLELLLSDSDTEPNQSGYEYKSYPNPTDKYTFVSYKLRKRSSVRIELLNRQGKLIKTIVNNEKRNYGRYNDRIDIEKYNLPSGMYFVKLSIDNDIKMMKIIVVQ